MPTALAGFSVAKIAVYHESAGWMFLALSVVLVALHLNASTRRWACR